MTVTTTSTLSGPYATDGVDVSFAFSFAIVNASELQVILRDADGVDTVVSPSSYSVALSTLGGTVTFSSAPASGYDLLIVSNPSFLQEIDFGQGGAYTSSAHNNANDRAVLRDLVLRDKAARSITVPVGETLNALPTSVGRAGKYLAFDAEGHPVPSNGTGNDADLRADLAERSTGAQLVAYGVRSVSSKLNEYGRAPEDDNATGDGVADDAGEVATWLGGKALVARQDYSVPALTAPVKTVDTLLDARGAVFTGDDGTSSGDDVISHTDGNIDVRGGSFSDFRYGVKTAGANTVDVLVHGATFDGCYIPFDVRAPFNRMDITALRIVDAVNRGLQIGNDADSTTLGDPTAYGKWRGGLISGGLISVAGTLANANSFGMIRYDFAGTTIGTVVDGMPATSITNGHDNSAFYSRAPDQAYIACHAYDIARSSGNTVNPVAFNLKGRPSYDNTGPFAGANPGHRSTVAFSIAENRTVADGTGARLNADQQTVAFSRFENHQIGVDADSSVEMRNGRLAFLDFRTTKSNAGADAQSRAVYIQKAVGPLNINSITATGFPTLLEFGSPTAASKVQVDGLHGLNNGDSDANITQLYKHQPASGRADRVFLRNITGPGPIVSNKHDNSQLVNWWPEVTANWEITGQWSGDHNHLQFHYAVPLFVNRAATTLIYRYFLEDGGAAMLKVRVVGVDSDGARRFQYKEILVGRSGTTFVIDATPVDQNVASAASPGAPTFTGLSVSKVDGASGYIAINLAGDAARTVKFNLEFEAKSIIKP